MVPSSANLPGSRWAAKEAVIKCSPPGRRLTLRDVIICQISDQPEKPRGIILDRTCSAEFEAMRVAASKEPPNGTFPPVSDSVVRVIRAGPNLQGQEVRISISHDGEYATAVAIAHYDDNMATTPTGGYK
jgi:holo-[acyl-carrier protein] synthase